MGFPYLGDNETSTPATPAPALAKSVSTPAKSTPAKPSAPTPAAPKTPGMFKGSKTKWERRANDVANNPYPSIDSPTGRGTWTSKKTLQNEWILEFTLKF